MAHLGEREELDLRRQLKQGASPRDELNIQRQLKETTAVSPTVVVPEPTTQDTSLVSFGVASGRGAMQLGRQVKAKMDAAVQQRQTQLTNILGENNFVAGEGLDDFLLRADLSRSNEFSEKRKKFLKKHGAGQLIAQSLGGGEFTTLFRRTKDEPFREVTPMKSSPIPNAGDLGTIAGVAVSEPVIAGGVGFLLGGPVLGAFATAGGVLAQSQIEEIRGFEDTPQGEVRIQAAVEGALTFGVDKGFGLGRRALGALGSGNLGGIFAQRPNAQRVVQAAEEERLFPVMAGQTARSPLVRGAFQQTAGTSPIPKEKAALQRLSLRGRFQEEASEEVLQALTDVELTQLVIASSEELDRIVVPYAVSTSKDAGGKALDRGFGNFKKVSREWVDRRYNGALAITDDVAYDLNRAQDLGKEIDAGVLSKTRKKAASELTHAEEFARALGETPEEILKGRQVSQKPTGELKAVIDDLLAIDPVISKFKVGGKEFDAFTQIKSIRTRLFDLKHSEDPFVRREANRLWGEFTQVMDNPISGDPNFVRAYRAASNSNTFREGILSLRFVRTIASRDIKDLGGASSVAESLIQPGNFDSLQLVKRLMPERDFRVLQNRFKSKLLNNPGTIQRELRKYRNEPHMLRLLISKDEIAAFEEFGFKMANLEKGPLQTIFQSDLDLGERAIKFANTATRKQMTDIVAQSGGPNSEFARSIKSGIYRHILDAATVIDDEGVTTLSPSLVMSQIKKLRPKMAGLFSAEDWRRLENFEVYAAVTSQTTDVGGQMQAGGVRGGITRFLSPLAQLRAVHTITSNSIVARILSSPTTYRMIQSAPRGRIGAGRVRSITAAAVIAMQQAQAGSLTPDELKQAVNQ